MPMDNVTLENTQQSISSRDTKSVASVMVNGKWVNLSDTLEQANVKSDVGTVSKQVAEQQEVVTSAVAQADSAVAYANDAVEKSRVNSQAIVDINSAVSDAVSGAAVARSDGLRAWNAAQSNVDLIDSNYASASAAISSARTEAIAAADEAKASASTAQADIVAVRSDVATVQADVTTNKSDVAAAKSDIAIAKTNLASQATSLSSYAAQASAAGKDITTLKSQAGQFEQDMADTKGDVSQLKVSASSASATLSDAAGNISSLQATAKSYSAALSDTNSNVASVTATASELETKYADAAGDISQIKTDAKGMTQTISNAQGDIAKLKTRADGFDAEFSTANGNISKLQTDATGTKQTMTNAKSDIAVLQSRADGIDAKYANAAGDINTLKVDASGMKQTLTDAKGDISTLQSTATGFKNTLTDAQGNISTLQSDVVGLKKTTSDHNGNIATLQADAKTLTSQMSSAQGDISTLKQTASGFSSKVSGMETSLANANNRLDNLKVGTSNLLHHSDTFDGWSKGNSVTVTSDKYLNGTIAVLGNTGIGGGSQIWTSLDGPYDNQPVTWTVYAKADNAGDKLHTELWGGGGYTDQPLTNNWQVYQFTGQRNVANPYFYFWGRQGNKGNIYVALPFAVVGNTIGTWSPNIDDVADKITTNSTAIEQNKKAITLKADQATVDKANGTVQQLQSQLKVQAGQINSKVSSSDLDAKGYATQTYTQTQVKQTADAWNANLTSVKNGLTQSYTNLHATVDGIQAQVYNKDGSSKITQLSNLVQTKVSSGDYNSQINQLKNDINLRVAKGNVISQINQEADGNTLIQVSNGKKSLILDAGNTIITGKAWIPSAAIANLTADQVQAGTLSGSKVHAGDNSGNGIDMGAISASYVGFHAYATNGDNTYIDLNGIHNYGATYDTRIQQGKITTDYLTVSGGGTIDFRDSNGTGMTASGTTLAFNVNNTPAGYLSYSGMPVAELPDGSGGNELQIRYGLSTAIIPNDNSGAQATFSGAAQKIAYMTGTDQGKKMLSGLEVHSDNHHWLGAVNSDATYNRIEINSNDGVNLTWHDNTHFWVSDGRAKLYKDTDDGQTATKLEVHGWAWVNGWVEAAGHSQHSALSTKTALQAIDDDEMLAMVNNTDLA
ncbi:gp58-like family protein, partial [Limosilactobacillus fermentum]|uniref:gp58-like family protein n=1 Tax=Limosilactobacillus fermentum TaxID=1613 RepID=UPI0021A6993C